MLKLNKRLLLVSLWIFFLLLILSCSSLSDNQKEYLKITKDKYHYMVPTTDIKDQQRTGTCWAYNSLSFFESETIRMGTADNAINLSEMYVVYHTYIEKAETYLDTMGENPFTEGGQDYDTMMVIERYGIVRESDYKAKNRGYHEKIVKEMKSLLDKTLTTYSASNTLPLEAKQEAISGIKSILDNKFGEVPQMIIYNEEEITPIEYAKDVLGINVNDYITLTSFTHLPNNEYVELELPDNWQHYDRYVNVDLMEMVELVKNSLRMGYSVSYSVDITEPELDWNNGYLVTTEFADGYEKMVSMRQTLFETGETTDDHGMHIIGMYDNETGYNDWFYLKNSWGKKVGDSGYIHLSEYYFIMKTISVMLHKDVFTDFEYLLPYFWG
jgi:bleomycin hydrolase